MDQWDEELEAIKPCIHRSYIPKHKKGGSVGYDTANELAPAITTVTTVNTSWDSCGESLRQR